ncbi:hypothetical protein IWQ55_006163 [Labrenzia sp. EL_208]|nr:hypothetical protein [Labrenzia sp. EL_132]MBG6232929.1 hypothetical protein [Labrenzia sp. EL_208]
MRAQANQDQPEKSKEEILTLENVERALDILAELVAGPRPNLLPAFTRMEQIHADLLADDEARARARARTRARKLTR